MCHSDPTIQKTSPEETTVNGHQKSPPKKQLKGEDSDPEVDVKTSGCDHRVISQRIINPNVLINLCPHRDRLQHWIHVNKGSMIQSWADLLGSEVRKVAMSNTANTWVVKKRKSQYRQTSKTNLLVEEETHPASQKTCQELIKSPLGEKEKND